MLPQNEHHANKRNKRDKENSSGSETYSHTTPSSPIVGVYQEVCRTISLYAAPGPSLPGSMKDFMLPGVRFPSDGGIDPAHMLESLRLKDLLDRICAWPMG